LRHPFKNVPPYLDRFEHASRKVPPYLDLSGAVRDDRMKA
jgi:hypothetical protein